MSLDDIDIDLKLIYNDLKVSMDFSKDHILKYSKCLGILQLHIVQYLKVLPLTASTVLRSSHCFCFLPESVEKNENHPCYIFKYLKGKPVRHLVEDEYLKINQAEEDGLVKVHFYMDHDSYMQKQIRTKLLEEDKDHVMKSCCQSLHSLLRVAPHQVDQILQKEKDYRVDKGLRILGVATSSDKDEASYCAIIDGSEEITDYQKMTSLAARGYLWSKKEKEAKDQDCNNDADVYFLDGSRIHPEVYPWARKMAQDALDYNEDAVKDILETPEKLENLDLDAFFEELKKQDYGDKGTKLYDIKAELRDRYKDQITPFKSATAQEKFNMLTKETPQTFYISKIVCCRVVGIEVRN
ncbi:hypothetical protein HELRODRAFT_173910 [Helobdella robusta]|uniref:HHH domain-containing protein n=1 Tax=Helobdella robusta TaxID=6412 RepID=T1F7D0_HELRO|nr:hypothetical protein HELRODRAFT_173910 [Helobdella robusta]ESO03042.1 hypothetical protein HELRODRAFT_173910 [Helobdella robusta]